LCFLVWLAYLISLKKMEKKLTGPFVKSLFAGLVVFSSIVFVTLFISRQKNQVRQKHEQEELQRELSHVKDRFRNILYFNLSTANSLAVIYNEYGKIENFDRIAAQLMRKNKFAEVIQLTINGIITNVYPKKGYEKTIGIDTRSDKTRNKEEALARKKSQIYYAGPRKLRQGGIGILGKVPIIENNQLKGLCVVLTKLETIRTSMEMDTSFKSLFAYQLIKRTPENDTVKYFLTEARPKPHSLRASTTIPEGDWILEVSYSKNYSPAASAILPIMGFLLATLAGFIAYRSTYRPYELEKIIALKTHELTAKEKYYRTLIQTSSDAIVLVDEVGKVLNQTPSTERISGYTLAEMQKLNGIELLHPDYRHENYADFIELLSSPGKHVKALYKFKHKQGHYIWIEGTYRNLLQEDGVKAIVFNYSDVTQRIESEHNLQKTEHQLKERVKELSIIYKVNTILQQEGKENGLVFPEIIEALPKGWQYPEISEARIEFNDLTFSTSKYKPSPYRQIASFKTLDGGNGTIEVIYTEEREPAFEGPFLKEERDLINTLAEIIQEYLNRKFHQESVVRSEARFRGAFEFSAIGMALVSLVGTFLQVNKALSEITGYSEKELQSLSFQQITHPDDLEEDLDFLQKAIAGTTDNYRVEKRYIHKNGSIIWVHINVMLIRDDKGNPAYFVTQIENITALRESELKFRNLVEKSVVGVYIILNGKFAYVNPWLQETFGYPTEKLISQPVTNFVYQEDLELVNRIIAARTRGEADSISNEIRVVKKNGEVIWLEIFGNNTLFGGQTALIGTMVDITGKKAAHDELVKSEANLKAIFDNSQVYFLLLDTNFRVLALNHHFFVNFRAHTGHELQIGENFIKADRPERQAILQENLESVLKTRQLINYEFTFTQQGTPQYLDITFSPVITADSVIGICISNIDITKRKLLEQERQKMLTELVARNKKMEEFAAIVSHTLRGPLSNILGLTNLVSEGISNASDETILNGIKTSAEKMNEVVTEMNQILYLESSFSEERTTVNLHHLIAELERDFRSEITATQAAITCHFELVKEFTTIRSFVQNILSNLLSNSLKFRNSEKAPEIKIRTEKIPGNVVICFQDNGMGIDMEKYGDQVFGLNKRFHPKISEKGLGLFMVKAQVESLNGTITVDSKINKGTTFTITLPVS
jgi:PAS domain S-box-containing protein